METTPISAQSYLLALFLLTEFGAKQWIETNVRDVHQRPAKTYIGFRAGHFLVNLAGAAVLVGFSDGLLATLVIVETLGSTELPLAFLDQTLRRRMGASLKWLQAIPMAAIALWTVSQTQSTTLSPLSGTAIDSLSLAFPQFNIDPSTLGSYVLGYAVLAQPANHVVRCFVGKPSDRSLAAIVVEQGTCNLPGYARAELAAARDAPGDPRAGQDTGPGDASTLRAGRTIGTLERWIMLTLALLGQFSLIGLVLTAKSIARFKRFEQDPEFAEYYLLGTLYSTFIALIVGTGLIHV